MGQEIALSSFGREDFELFSKRLNEETRLFDGLCADSRLSQNGFVIGFEIEAWLLDHGFFPNPVNQRFLETLDHPMVVPELSRFNVELNCDPLPLTGDVLSRAANDLSRLWDHCNHVAHGMDTNLVMIGTLPVIRDEDLNLSNLSPLERYRALNAEILRRHGGRPLVVDIAGTEHLHSEHRDVMLEAATTSFQIHLKVPAAQSAAYYNASVLASAPLLAASVNAPFLFGRRLWQETRIPLFEQSIALFDRSGRDGRVSFGNGYVQSGLFELFAQNRDAYPVLLPILFDDSPSALRHMRLHNGTIWRWNRPLAGFEQDGTPHLRIEHRTMPAGPTIIDMIANAACYFGVVRDIADNPDLGADSLPFESAKRNFYEAARHGLDAGIDWPHIGRIPVRSLLLDHVLPAARRGLRAFCVSETDIAFFLDILEARVANGQTGAKWQIEALEHYGGDFHEMMSIYCERQRSGMPVHQWDL